MKSINKIIKILTAITCMLYGICAYAADSSTQVILPNFALITGMNATASITLNSTDIETAIANGTPLNTGVIAEACMFTTDPNGDFDVTVTAGANFKEGADFALYNATLGKIVTSLKIVSTNDAVAKNLAPGVAQQLTDHSSPDSNGTNCSNKVQFTLHIDSSKLRTAQAGEYSFDMSVSTSTYSGPAPAA